MAESIFNKITGLRPLTLFKKTQVFCCEFCEIFMINFFYRKVTSTYGGCYCSNYKTFWQMFLIFLQSMTESLLKILSMKVLDPALRGGSVPGFVPENASVFYDTFK